jgi:hypothetical protein
MLPKRIEHDLQGRSPRLITWAGAEGLTAVAGENGLFLSTSLDLVINFFPIH